MTRISESDTKTLILDAAEQAFADLGFAAASLRHIIGVAGVNIAAIHYHFGSKEALIEAVFARRIGPVNDARLRLLDELEATAGSKAPSVQGVVEAFVGPALRMATDPARGGHVVTRLFGRMIAEPSEQLQRMLAAQFGTVLQRFTQALHRALPAIPEPVLLWRFHFLVGAMAHTMTDPAQLKVISCGHCDPRDTEAALKHLAAFVSAGFHAPVPH